jgi:hypothetical protein
MMHGQPNINKYQGEIGGYQSGNDGDSSLLDAVVIGT